MKSPFSDKPATAALEAFVSSSVSVKCGNSLQDSLQSANMQDLFEAVRSDNELGFPSISWEDEEEGGDRQNNYYNLFNSNKGVVMRRQSLGYCPANHNLLALARSKTLRTSISSLAGPVNHHPLSRHV